MIKKIHIEVIILLLIFVWFLTFSFFNNNNICKATNSLTLIEITQSNFIEEFYNNDKLLDESGKNYYVKFVEDIDLGVLDNGIGANFVRKFTPIGKDSVFTAFINGNNKTISNLSVNFNMVDNIAFFGTVSSKIINLTLSNMSINCKENASVFALNLENSITENIQINSCELYAKNCSGFANSIINSYVKNVNIDVEYNYLEKGFEFSQFFNNSGLKEISVNNLGLLEVENNVELNNWNNEIQVKYEQTNSQLNKIYTVLSAGINNNDEIFNNSKNDDKHLFHLLFSLCVVAVSVVMIIKSFFKVLTKK